MHNARYRTSLALIGVFRFISTVWESSPKIAATGWLAFVAAWELGFIKPVVRTDSMTSAQVLANTGLIARAATKSDIAELRALIESIKPQTTEPITTGSITKRH